jgi:hypothetical protein
MSLFKSVSISHILGSCNYNHAHKTYAESSTIIQYSVIGRFEILVHDELLVLVAEESEVRVDFKYLVNFYLAVIC